MSDSLRRIMTYNDCAWLEAAQKNTAAIDIVMSQSGTLDSLSDALLSLTSEAFRQQQGVKRQH